MSSIELPPPIELLRTQGYYIEPESDDMDRSSAFIWPKGTIVFRPLPQPLKKAAPQPSTG